MFNVNKVTGNTKKNPNFVIRYDKNEVITDGFDMAKSFNESLF